jgi:hypothetical protein
MNSIVECKEESRDEISPSPTNQTVEVTTSQEFEFADLIPFPQKLFALLAKEPPSIVTWIPTGNAFRILDGEKFQQEVIPKYFKHTKFASFQRQLNLYGFRRVTKGDAQGAYVHPKFQAEKPELVAEIRRLPSKSYNGGNKQQKAAQASVAPTSTVYTGAVPLVVGPTSEDMTLAISLLAKRAYQGGSRYPAEAKEFKRLMTETSQNELICTSSAAWDNDLSANKRDSFGDFEFFESIDWSFEYDAEGVI